ANAVRWSTAAVFLAFWLTYNNGLRPEPVGAFGVLATWVSLERALATGRLLPAAAGCIIGGPAPSAAPPGRVSAAPSLAPSGPLPLPRPPPPDGPPPARRRRLHLRRAPPVRRAPGDVLYRRDHRGVAPSAAAGDPPGPPGRGVPEGGTGGQPAGPPATFRLLMPPSP